jgi:arylsulfatase A-like enzyme
MTTPVDLSRRSLLAGLAPAILRAAPRRPNIVFFLTDDHGAWATGAYGCASIHTPNVDQLAAGGTRFSNAYAATPVCSPSRMTWMTGLMPSVHGVQDYLSTRDSFGPSSRAFLQGHRTYSELLAAGGYRCGLTGKWHMGHDDQAQCGFSYWATVPGGGGPYQDAEFVVNGARRRMPGFKEDAIGDFALEFIQQNRRNPFFLLVPFYAPHTPYNYQPDQDRVPYLNSPLPCFPNLPTHPNQNPVLRQHHGNRASMQAYSALVTGMDRNIGRVLQRLHDLSLRDDTLVIFSADQGWNAGHHGVWGKGNGTVPYNMYEESIRVPLIWNHPGRIRAGSTSDALVSSYDFLPTLLDYAGIATPRDSRRPGVSYKRCLHGNSLPHRDSLCFEYAYMRAIRTRTHKYVERTAPMPSELYNLNSDPGETTNLVNDARQSATRAGLSRSMDDFFRRAGAPPLNQWRTTTTQELPPEQS